MTPVLVAFALLALAIVLGLAVAYVDRNEEHGIEDRVSQGNDDWSKP